MAKKTKEDLVGEKEHVWHIERVTCHLVSSSPPLYKSDLGGCSRQLLPTFLHLVFLSREAEDFITCTS